MVDILVVAVDAEETQHRRTVASAHHSQTAYAVASVQAPELDCASLCTASAGERPWGPDPAGIEDESPDCYADRRVIDDRLCLANGPPVERKGRDRNRLCRGHRREIAWVRRASPKRSFRCALTAKSLGEGVQTDDGESTGSVNQDASVFFRAQSLSAVYPFVV